MLLSFLGNFTNEAKLMMVGMPESLALLTFGVSLIVLTVGLRWMFDRKDQMKVEVKGKQDKK
jgi:hypothetical protein